MGIWPQKPCFSEVFGGQMPIFSPTTSIFIIRGNEKSNNESTQKKKVGVTHEKMGIWRQKCKNKVFGVKRPFFHLPHPFFFRGNDKYTMCLSICTRIFLLLLSFFHATSNLAPAPAPASAITSTLSLPLSAPPSLNLFSLQFLLLFSFFPRRYYNGTGMSYQGLEYWKRHVFNN